MSRKWRISFTVKQAIIGASETVSSPETQACPNARKPRSSLLRPKGLEGGAGGQKVKRSRVERALQPTHPAAAVPSHLGLMMCRGFREHDSSSKCVKSRRGAQTEMESTRREAALSPSGKDVAAARWSKTLSIPQCSF